MRIQALGPKTPNERLDEGVLGGLARAAEVERDIVQIRPQIKLVRYKLRVLIDRG